MEKKLIRELPQRKDYIINLFRKISKQGITVGTFVTTKYGENIYESLTGIKPKGKKFTFQKQKELGVFFIDGKTKGSERDKIRLYLNSEESTNEILIAQNEVVSTGNNYPKLKNFVFIEPPGKSFTKILQSIGRVMRKSEASGDNVYVWDIVDCFNYSTDNYSLLHFWERLEYYEKEQHPVIEKEVKLE